MGRNGFFGAFQGLDAFGKTMEDVKIKTRTGAFLTFLSLSIILTSLLVEFVDYRQVHSETSIVVDNSRGEKIVIDLDVTFPSVPCYLLSIDVADISGEIINDISHNIKKMQLDQSGNEIGPMKGGQLKGEAERIVESRAPDYCGNCYGAPPPENGCCNSCEEVRQAYIRAGWSFSNPDGIEQCVEEHWTEKMAQQAAEGCRVSGKLRVNKVIGNVRFSHGATFMRNGMNLHELVPYLKDKHHHDFDHIINKWHFGADIPDFAQEMLKPKEDKTRIKLKIKDPLTGVTREGKDPNTNNMYQYFVKVVSTSFQYLTGDEIPTNQYSVTEYERDVRGGLLPGKDEHGHMTSHSNHAIPGLFINYEISPMKVIHRETRQSFAHFLTSACAIIGGVLTVASLIDSAIFSGRKHLEGKKDYDGFGAPSGKML
ncbi:ER-derived vesicles protein erv46 [Vanrija albida]|uniref:ER-derived vesicles protein erv46 n=1 Tax=Vanrija albida TaxID=181172 RepID=A0ABR3Q9I4_9TREE